MKSNAIDMKEVSEYGKVREDCQRKVKVMSISRGVRRRRCNSKTSGSGDEWRN